MGDEVIYMRYRELACAVIKQAVDDWLKHDQSDYALYLWIMNCEYFDHLNIDREYFYVKCLKLKESKKKTKRGRGYGKRKESQQTG